WASSPPATTSSWRQRPASCSGRGRLLRLASQFHGRAWSTRDLLRLERRQLLPVQQASRLLSRSPRLFSLASMALFRRSTIICSSGGNMPLLRNIAIYTLLASNQRTALRVFR